MYYVYVLSSLDEKQDRYIGYTTDLKRRLEQHNQGKGAKMTRNRQWRLVYYEAYSAMSDAQRREQCLKDGRAIYHLYERIRESLTNGSA